MLLLIFFAARFFAADDMPLHCRLLLPAFRHAHRLLLMPLLLDAMLLMLRYTLMLR